MSFSVILFGIGCFLMVSCGAGLLLALARGGSVPKRKRMIELVRTSEPRDQKPGADQGFKESLMSVIRAIRRKLGLKHDDSLLERLSGAGLARGSADAYFAARFICPLTGLFIGTFVPGTPMAGFLLPAGLGYLAPDFWLRRRTKRRRQRIRRGVPDAIDLLVVCVGTGMGLDQALLRVGQEIRVSHREVHEEILRVNREQRAGKPRLEAWKTLADRTQVEEFSLFVNMLVQSDRFGTPLLLALNRLSDDLRMKRRHRAEEQAAKTKIKILFPLVLFIFPCIFIVLLGPAILSIGKSLAALH